MAMAVGYAILGAGATATAAAVVGSIVVGAITFTASYLLAKKAMGNQSSGMDSNDYTQMIKNDKAARRVIYGERLVSGVMNFAEEQEGTQTTGEDLYLGVYVCDHAVNAITKVMLNDKEWDEYGGNAEYVLNNGGDGIEARDWMMNGGYLPEPEPGEDPPETGLGAQQWEDTMLGEGALWMGWKLNFNREYFTQIPTPKLLVEGKRVKDYRTNEDTYTSNAALVIADFLTNYMNVKESRIITSGWGSFIDAANLCDEVMDTGERRYTINGMFELADQKPSDILNAMLKACGGTLVRMNGKIGLLPAAYYGVATVTIGESDIISGLEVIPQEAMSTAANVISGSFISPDDDFAKVDFEPIKDESAIARDGYEIDETIDYDLVTNEWQAQRLANIELRRRTLGSHINFTANMKGLYCRVGRVINLELPQFGISGEYRVLEQSLGEDGVSLSLQREDIDVYDDSVGSPYNPPPILNLPTGDIGSPTGLQFIAQEVGNTIQGKIVWTEVALAERYNVQLRNYDTDELVYATSTEATNTDVSGISLGNYKARVQSVAASGKVSGWAESSFVISKPVKPTSVEVKRSNWNIQLVPTITGGVPQGTLFDFYHIEDTQSYIEGQPTYDASNIGLAKLVGRGSSLNHGGLIPDRFEHYWIISSNSYGSSEAYYVQTGTAKEQDLVTTVVERLVAIEIESSNWDDAAGTGYKIFSPKSDPYTMPDGTVLENPDGLIVVNQIVAKGHITAESLTFVSDDAIPDSINNEKAVEETKTYVDQNYVDAVTYGTEIADIQAQLDKSITSWFGDATPTADNYPAVDWTTTELKDQHLGDLYYDNDDGLSYRWSIDNGTYLWIRVVDSGVEAALAAAAKAQDTADSKRRVFFGTPVPPYDRGDLWDTGDGIKRCDVASITTYSPAHWIWSTDGSGAADAAELAAKQHADQKAATAEANAKLYADAEAELARITAEAYADGIVDEEEARAIADAQAKADIAEANAKAASDPKGSADAALIAANTHADAQANLAQVTAEAYADGVADDAELEAIAEAQRLADAAEAAAKAASDPKGSASNAEQAAKQHADAQANLAQVTAEAYADGIVDEEEARAIADAQAKADAAEQNAKQYADEIPNPVIFSDDTRRTILRDLGEFETVNIDAEYSGTHVLRVIQEVANDLSWSLNGVEQPAIENLDTFVTVELTGGNNVLVFWDKGEFTDPQIVVTLIEMTSVGGNSAENYVENRIYPDQDNLQIQGSYQQGVTGWAIDANGNSEFNNILARGRMESSVFQGGMIIGSTIYAVDEEILADPYGDGTPTFYLSHPEIPVSVLPQVVSTNTIATPVYAQFDLYSAADNYTEPDQRRSKEIVLPAGAMTGSYTYPKVTWGVSGKQGDVSFSDFYNRSQTVTLRFVETDSGNAYTQSLTFSPIVSSTNYITLGGVSFKIQVTTYYEPESTYSGGHQGEDTYIAKGYFGFNLTVTNEEGNLGNVDDIEKNGLFSLTLTGDAPYWRNTRKYGDQNFYFVTEGRNISASVNLDNEA